MYFRKAFHRNPGILNRPITRYPHYRNALGNGDGGARTQEAVAGTAANAALAHGLPRFFTFQLKQPAARSSPIPPDLVF